MLAVVILVIIGFVYAIVYWAIPADRKRNALKEMEQAAAIRGPEIMVILVEEVKKLREALERLEGKMGGR